MATKYWVSITDSQSIVLSPNHGEEPGPGGGRHRVHRPADSAGEPGAGSPALVLMRPEIGLDIDKLQMLLSFKAQGARLVEATLEDHAALVAAVAQGDVVISAMSGVHFRSHNLSLQHKLVEAIKEAGNIKVRHFTNCSSILATTYWRFRKLLF